MSLHLDFILLFAALPLSGAILESTQHGVWTFLFGNPAKLDYCVPGFWEIQQRDPITSVSLVALANQSKPGLLLYQGFFPTIKSSLSRNLDQLLYGSAEWPLRICRDLQNACANFAPFEESLLPRQPCAQASNLDALACIYSMTRAFVRERYERLFVRDQWHVGLVQGPVQSFVADKSHDIQWLPDRGRLSFMADPFGVVRDSNVTIFFEDFNQTRQLGHIAAIESHDGGRTFSEPRRLEGGLFSQAELHLSYPYIVEHSGEIFCIPESCNANAVCLHRAVAFPYRWELAKVLLEGVDAVDVTVFPHADYWWMFYTTRSGGTNTKLYLAYATDLLGTWTNHLANPIKTDVRCARPGGTPFKFDGKLYRPAQDSTHTYGGSMVINEIEQLTTTEFRERMVVRLHPHQNGRYARGFHTLSSAGCLTLVDGKRFVSVPELLPTLVRPKLKALVGKFSR
jgi:hypothetical protein